MFFKSLSTVIAATGLLVAPATAQNDAFAAPQIYNGVTLDQIATAMDGVVINGQPLTITKAQTGNGVQFLTMSSAAIPFDITAAGIGGGYNGSSIETFAGYSFFVTMRAGVVSQTAVNSINHRAKFAKIVSLPEATFLAAEALAAGGIAADNIPAHFNALFLGLTEFVKGAQQTEVSYSPKSINYMSDVFLSVGAVTDTSSDKISSPAVIGASGLEALTYDYIETLAGNAGATD